ncbi:unnamed protein product [marine sediment metagenome]|uniref:Uncharacterized protein n=1 Tax=marine sediment metagenome TaxID=412755 RepID=X1KFY4_9ZZZZ
MHMQQPGLGIFLDLDVTLDQVTPAQSHNKSPEVPVNIGIPFPGRSKGNKSELSPSLNPTQDTMITAP